MPEITISSWALKHGISAAALRDLGDVLSSQSNAEPPAGEESQVVKLVRLEASKRGARLWRNNSGAGKLENGSFVRWGLCNESPGMNKVMKSADLIGIKPVIITPSHVGTVIGQFLARECKHPGWKYSGTDRERAQLNFLTLIETLGGDAKFTNSEGSI